MLDASAKKLFITKYEAFGDEKFYKFLIGYAVNKIVNIENVKGALPHTELLDYHDKFMILYRREGVDEYLCIAKLFRKSAHKIYSLMLKKNMCSINFKFLNLVKNK